MKLRDDSPDPRKWVKNGLVGAARPGIAVIAGPHVFLNQYEPGQIHGEYLTQYRTSQPENINEPLDVYHLSDLHIGDPRYTPIARRVVEKLIAIKEENKQALFLLTGDIVAAPTQNNFDRAGELLEDISDQMIFVPGNHDINTLTDGVAFQRFDGFRRRMQTNNQIRRARDPFCVLYGSGSCSVCVIGVFTGRNNNEFQNLAWALDDDLYFDGRIKFILTHSGGFLPNEHRNADRNRERLVSCSGHNHDADRAPEVQGYCVSSTVATGITGKVVKFVVKGDRSLDWELLD